MPETILICDDEHDFATQLSDELRPMAEAGEQDVQILPVTDFADAIMGLEERRLAAREGRPPSDALNPIDTAAVLIVDYDLIRLQVPDLDDKMQGLRIDTGEHVAYLARCFSRAATIVALNQFLLRGHPSRFDLALRPHLESYADHNIHGEQIANPGLWGMPYAGYRPWHWPDLSRAPQLHRARIDELKNKLDEPVLDFLRLRGGGTAVDHLLTRRNLEELSVDVEDARFSDVIRTQPLGLRGQDEPWDDLAELGIASARVHKWLEGSVLTGEHVLVDAPHLVSRFPSLLDGDSDDIECWDGLAEIPTPSRLAADRLHDAFGLGEPWISRDTWRWPIIQRDEAHPEVAEPWNAVSTPFVFCEDVSRFRPRDQARQFVADVDPPFSLRFVATRGSTEGSGKYSLDAVQYRNARRFAQPA